VSSRFLVQRKKGPHLLRPLVLWFGFAYCVGNAVPRKANPIMIIHQSACRCSASPYHVPPHHPAKPLQDIVANSLNLFMLRF